MLPAPSLLATVVVKNKTFSFIAYLDRHSQSKIHLYKAATTATDATDEMYLAVVYFDTWTRCLFKLQLGCWIMKLLC